MIRISTNYALSGTDTYRASSRKTILRQGGNVQNPSQTMVSLWIPDEDKVFVNVDQAGAEAFIVANIAPPGQFLELFQAGVKSHVFVAMHVFSKEWAKELEVSPELFEARYLSCRPGELAKSENWTTLDELIKELYLPNSSEFRYYDLGKMICHAANYGMEAQTFQMNCLIKSQGRVYLALDEARRFLRIYHTLFPEIKCWHFAVRREAFDTGQIVNLFGYPIKITGHLNQEKIKSYYSYCPQSTVGCITHIALTKMQEYVEDKGKVEWDVLSNKHDSVLMQAPERDVKEVAEKLSEFMSIKFEHKDRKFQMKTEAEWGRNVKKMERLKL